MRVTYKLPPGIKGFKYVPNHHYVELEDTAGNIVHMPATGLLRCECTKCAAVFMVFYNSGSDESPMSCPHCRGPAKARWGKLQIAFVPEDETAFMSPEAAKADDTAEIEPAKEE